jgi:2-polyprenyl-3-methyl-5-hydroxy-6-metoxy-1,4-benzoquinol methylase
MTQAAYDCFYNGEYRPLYTGVELATEEFFQEQIDIGRGVLQFLEQSGHSLTSSQERPFVVEVGCGAGGLLEAFRMQGSEVLGFDVGREYAEYGRSKHGLDIVVGPFAAERLPRKADLIIFNQVVEHLLDPVAQLQVARACLADGGAIFLAVPGVKWLHNSYQMDLLKLLQNAHVWHFTQTTLGNLCTLSGLRMVTANEQVKMLVVPAPSSSEYTSDREAVYDYLKWIENERSHPRTLLKRIFQDPDIPVINFLKKIASTLGIKQRVKNLLYGRARS